ncbi:TetR/AcrR family transcriptional regulator [Cytobacillus kochii]|uniref:TetR/AcrR family transcriptional regulator n=1 Tax=Cytobacillus kochii TaxID=859143 RepID=UPI002E205B77|nr:TetR/AcrR family transcriptional regulator [Cytobacillus kochii]
MNSIRVQNLRKEEIITAALKVFSENGFENTTMQKIANETGLSKGLLYHYFSSKKDIVQACLDWAMEDTQSLMGELERSKGKSIEKLMYFTKSSLSSKRRNSFKIIQSLIKIDESKNKRYIEQFSQLVEEKLLPIFAEGIMNGEIVNRDPVKTIDLYLTVLSGLLQEEITWGEEDLNWNTERLIKIIKN